MAWAAGDLAGAESLFASYFGELAGWSASLVGDPDEGRDIAAEAFVRLLGASSPIESPRAFLYGVAANLVRDRWRKQKRGRRALLRWQATDPMTQSGPDVTVRDAVDRLPEDERVSVLLFYYADLTTREIAQVTMRPEGTIRRQLSSARRRLHLELEEVQHG